MSLRSDFLEFDDSLARLGVPPLTAWWRVGIGDWLDAYEAGHVLELTACVGRGGAKSTALYKLALFFALFGDFTVPPGEIHYAIVLSRLKEEASKGVAIIARWLTLLGIAHRPAGDVIELGHAPRGIRVVAASVAATSGWRSFFVGRDERSKWSADGAIEQDADEIDTSAVAMTATHRYAPTVTTGSAWGMTGSFYETVSAGSDANRIVLGPAATWIVAPHITEEDCRRKERDPSRFAREYQCVFQATESSAFDPLAVERAFTFRDRQQGDVMGSPIVVIDASSLKADSFTWGLVRWIRPALPGLPYLSLSRIDGVEGGWSMTSIGTIVGRIVGLAKRAHAASVHGDQRESFGLRTLFNDLDVVFIDHPWTNAAKVRAVERVRALLRDGALELQAHEKLKAELLGFEEKINSSGALTYGARGKQHDDYCALLLTATLAEEAGHLRCPEPGEGGASQQGGTVVTYRSQW